MTAEAVVTEREQGEELQGSIRAAKGGDSDAFEEIMLATERRVASLAWRILGDRETVKDAMQETFMRVYRHLDQYREEEDFIGWLYRITVNVCRDIERRRRRWRFFHPLADAASLTRPARFDEAYEARDRLARAIDALPPRERLAIILRDVQELPTEEVATILGVRQSSLRVSISKARAKLRKWMEER